jgi:putative flippase GtrA
MTRRVRVWPVHAIREAWQTHEKLRFLVVGIYNTLFGYGVFVILYMGLHKWLHYLVVLVISHILAVSNAFLGHRRLTFRVEGNLLVDFLRFNLSYMGVLAFSIGFLPFLVRRFEMSPLVGGAITTLLATIGSFFLHKRVSFRR